MRACEDNANQRKINAEYELLYFTGANIVSHQHVPVRQLRHNYTRGRPLLYTSPSTSNQSPKHKCHIEKKIRKSTCFFLVAAAWQRSIRRSLCGCCRCCWRRCLLTCDLGSLKSPHAEFLLSAHESIRRCFLRLR